MNDSGVISTVTPPNDGIPLSKKNIIPLSDTQVLSPSSDTKKRKREITESVEEEFIPKKIDIDKELQSFITNPILDILPQKESHLKVSDSIFSFINPPLSDRSSTASTINSDPIPSSGTPSSSQSHELLPSDSLSPNSVYLLRNIYHIVKENQSLLNSLTNRSLQTFQDPEVLQSQLEAEKARSSQLSEYLSECMESNDALVQQVEKLQKEIDRLQTTDVEFSILNKGVKLTLEQNDQLIASFQKQCSELKDQLAHKEQHIYELQKQLHSQQPVDEDTNPPPFPVIELSEQAKTASSLQFMNQLLIQQLAEERKRSQNNTQCSVSMEKWKEAESQIDALHKEVESLRRDNDELKQMLSKTDLTDYQLIDDSLDDSIP